MLTSSKLGGKSCTILATADDQNNLFLWRLTKTKPKFKLDGLTSQATVLTFNESASKLFSGSDSGTVYIWDLS